APRPAGTGLGGPRRVRGRAGPRLLRVGPAGGRPGAPAAGGVRAHDGRDLRAYPGADRARSPAAAQGPGLSVAGAEGRCDGQGLAPRVAVVGAGLAGLAAAVELKEAGCRVELFERGRLLGGRATSYD